MQIDPHYENLIIRYLNGECTGPDTEELKKWIEADEGNRKLLLEVKDTWDSIPGKDIPVEQQLVAFYKRQLERHRKSLAFYWKQAVAAAAVLAIGLFSGILLTHEGKKDSGSEIVLSVPFGSKSAVTLADGSEVVLNSGSTITYQTGGNDTGRQVHLSGEGFFRIKPDKKNPFIVSTDDFRVQVTGTSFNICSYLDNPYSSTTLTEGQVSLIFNRSGQRFDMLPGERIWYDRKENKYSKGNVDVEPEIAWKDGDFIFRNAAFSELVRRLERWYDVRIIFDAPELREFSYTGRFKNQETIWQVLDAMKLTTPIDYRRVSFREFEILYMPQKR